MTVQRHFVFAVAALLSVTAGAASATVTLNADVESFVGTTAGDNVANDFHIDTWTNTPRDLSSSATATAISDLSGVTAGAAVSAQWASANAGSVTANLGWTVGAREVGVGIGANLSDPVGAPGWEYQFTATGSDTFNLAFDLNGTGDTLGLGNWSLAIADFTGGTFTLDPLSRDFTAGTSVTGNVHEHLFLGHTYNVSLSNNDLFSEDPILLAPISRAPTTAGTGSESDQFNWTISGDGGLNGGGVPEPSTWALSILGFGLSGAALRRRRGTAAAAA